LFAIGFFTSSFQLLFGQAGIVEYSNQDSKNTFFHSGLCTATGTVWDTKFGEIAANSLTPGYNEIAFAFMQCHGGGMIDEVAGQAPSAFTSAARWDERAWAWDPVARNPANYESTYNLPFAPAVGGAAVNGLKQAAIIGRNQDVLGPVINRLGPPFLEHPQYTSSGVVGDSIRLHRNNPVFGQNPNTGYLALLFGGSTADPGNTNSLTRITNALTARGYVAAEMRVINPAGTAAQLLQGWQWVRTNTTPGTQVFFWSSWGHGELTFDLLGFIKKVFGNFIKGVTYTFTLDSTFLAEINALTAYYPTSPASLDGPYFEIDSTEQLVSPSVTLSTPPMNIPVTLTLTDQVDVFGDGTLWQARFALNNITGLTFSTSGNTVSISFANTGMPIVQTGIATGLKTNTAIPVNVSVIPVLRGFTQFRPSATTPGTGIAHKNQK
jgi:hypothetical protein